VGATFVLPRSFYFAGEALSLSAAGNVVSVGAQLADNEETCESSSGCKNSGAAYVYHADGAPARVQRAGWRAV